MRVVHDAGAGEQVLATEVELAESLLTRARGLMFRRGVPTGYALVFQFERQATRRLHMLCVPFDVDAVWVADGVVQQVKQLSAWTGYGSGVADTIVEFPAGTADDVEPGDRMWVEP